jgi:HK97 gp10 family phage protein
MAGGFMHVSVIGDDVLVAKLEKAMAATVIMQPTALQASGLLVERRAKQIVVEKDVIDTGNLLGNIVTHPPEGDSIEIVSQADYSIFNEYGTYKMAARPYMRPALDETKPEIEKLIGAMFIGAVSGAMGGGGIYSTAMHAEGPGGTIDVL